MSRDPIGFGGGDWNGCRYADSAPSRSGDPTGLFVLQQEVGDLGQFEAERDKRRQIYTCACGWLENGHVFGAIGSVHTMRGFLTREPLLRAGRIRFEVWTPVRYGLYASRCFWLERPLSGGVPDDVIWSIAEYITYSVYHQVESVQHAFGHPSGFSYEDLPSNWVGVTTARRGDTVQAIARRCGPLDFFKAICLYGYMEQDCRQGSCHRSPVEEVTTAEPKNPVPEAHLFHRRYATTLRFCSQPSPGMAEPPDLYASRGLSQWVSQWPRCGPSAPSYRI
jgi:hypothetical protein